MSGRPRTDFLARVRERWPAPAPEWVVALAEACATRTQAEVGRQIGYSASAVSATLANSYGGDLDAIAEKVRGAFLGQLVACPRKGAMRRDVCMTWQAKPWAPTSSDRVAMFHACRSGCPHSRLKEG